MNKRNLFIALFFIHSCSYINYAALPALAKTVVFGVEDIIVNNEFYNSQTSSFVKVKIGKKAVAIFVLARVDSDQFHWVSSNGGKLITLRNGQAIKLLTEGYGFSLISNSTFPRNLLDKDSQEYMIQLDDPFAIFSQRSFIYNNGIKETLRFGTNVVSTEILEMVSSSSMKWEYENYYVLEEATNLPLSARIYFSPLDEPLELTFYYKY